MQVYLVGGAVRDELLNRKVTERDYVVVGATPQQMLEKGFTQVGKDFPVFLHPKTKEEYALARTERKSGKGYTGFVCDASASVSLKDDLLRRDLTINAMAKDANGTITDPFGGQEDLKSKVLRHVSAAFVEDPLRVFRVARFAARYAHLGFTVAPQTMQLMQQVARQDELAHLSAERVWTETQRSLMERDPQVYFTTLAEANALAPWLAELSTLSPNAYKMVKLAADKQATAQVRFATITTQLSAEQTGALCKRIKAPNSYSELAILAAKFALPLTKTLSAEQLLEIFNLADGWRKPDRFSELLEVVSYQCASTPQYADTDLILHALHAAAGIDTRPIIQAGFQGAAIKSELDKQRTRVIAQIIADKGGTA